MTETTGKYADFEGLRRQAVDLRREGLSRRQTRDRLHVHNNDILNRLLEGEPRWRLLPRLSGLSGSREAPICTVALKAGGVE